MNDLDIEKLADYIAANQEFSDFGLFTGISGNCILLYELSRKKDKHKKQADLLFNQIIKLPNLSKLNPNFGFGLAGIGWSIEYLHKNNFCKTEEWAEVIKTIDDAIFKTIIETEKIPLDLSTGLVGYLLYIISRLENKNIDENAYLINKELFKILINRIDDVISNHYILLTKDIGFDGSSTFHVLFYALARGLKLNIYNEKIINIIKEWILYIETLLPGIHSNRLCLAMSLRKLNDIIKLPELEKHIDLLLFSIDFNRVRQECNVNSLNLNLNWIGLIFCMKKATELFANRHTLCTEIENLRGFILKKYKSNYIDIIRDSIDGVNHTRKENTGLLSGLGGTCLIFSLYPTYFE